MTGLPRLDDARPSPQAIFIDRIAKKIGVVDRPTGVIDGGERHIDDIGRVQPAAEADFQQKAHRPDGARTAGSPPRSSISNTVIGSPPLARSHSSQRRTTVHRRKRAGLRQPDTETKAFVEIHQMRRGVSVHAQARGFQNRAQETRWSSPCRWCRRYGRPAAACARDDPKPREQPLHAIERPGRSLGMQRQHISYHQRPYRMRSDLSFTFTRVFFFFFFAPETGSAGF